MNFIKILKRKTWLDWVKIIIAIDIAAVGIGLILGFDMHALAYVFGFISRIIFGILYLSVSFFIFQYVFAEIFDVDEEFKTKTLSEFVSYNFSFIKNKSKSFSERLKKFIDIIHQKLDTIFNTGEHFLNKYMQKIMDKINTLNKK